MEMNVFTIILMIMLLLMLGICIEGIVFYRGNGEMCKIKRSDFGFSWNRKEGK